MQRRPPLLQPPQLATRSSLAMTTLQLPSSTVSTASSNRLVKVLRCTTMKTKVIAR